MAGIHATLPGDCTPWHSSDRDPARSLVPTGVRPSASHYRPRDPRRTPLYRVFVDHWETFKAIYEDSYEPQYGPLGPHVEHQAGGRPVDAYLECGLYSAGCMRVQCADCGHGFLVPFSCKARYLCPSCHQRKAILWAEEIVDEILEAVPHRQWVFTIPKRLRWFFRRDRKLLGQLSPIAAKVLQSFFREALGADVKPGIVSVLQTFNSDLTYNPHPHLVVTDGCLAPDGAFTRLSIVRKEHLALIQEAFRREVLQLLLRQGLLDEDDVENMLSWPHSGFGVHNEVKILPGDREGFIDLVKYLSRPPVALARMRYSGGDDPLIHIRLKRPHWRTGRRELSFQPLEFLARLLQHVPPLGFKSWRRYGAYSAVVRARWRDARADEVATPPTTDEKTPGRKQCTASWAALLSRVWGFDVLVCPDCGGRLEIVAAIHDSESLERITRHYGLDTEVPPLQPARAPPWIQDELELGMVDEPTDGTDIDVDPNPDGFTVDSRDDDGLPIFIVD